jgi:hypothetical protein
MIHLVTLAGSHVDVLAHMLEHYRSLGVESFFVILNLADELDPVREQVEEITRRFGCGIAGVMIGDWHLLQQQAYLTPREQYPSDWFLLADQDELQVYPAPLHDVIADCGPWDFLRGCFVDRIARDGGFPSVDREKPIWEQFPLGGFITGLIGGGDPRKVVAVKGALPIRKGNHHAYEGRPCPSRQHYIPVHHFKWTANIAERMAARAEMMKQHPTLEWTESARFVEYCRSTGGRIRIEDPRLMIGECTPDYPYWEKVKKIVLKSAIVPA